MRNDSRICREVLDVARRLSRWLFWQPEVGEESLTDWFLFEIADRLPFVWYHKFTRPQEAKDTGADWEWWFIGHRFSLALRIQAKKISGESDYYRAIAYTNRYGLQIEKLIEGAERSNCLPLYALYHSSPTPPQVRRQWNEDDGLYEGVFLASAAELHERYIMGRRVKVNDSDLLQMSITLSSLFCCQASSQTVEEPVKRAHSRLTELLFSPSQEAESSKQAGIHSEVPEYVRALLHNDRFEINWSEVEAPQDVNALLVFNMKAY